MNTPFLTSLEPVHAELQAIWPGGRESSCCPNDGRHYTMKGHSRPVSVGQVEARLLYNLAVSSGAKRAFEIGTGFGYSSFWLGAAIFRNHAVDGWLGSIDNHSEGGVGQTGLEFAVAGSKLLGLDQTTKYFVGTSPVDLYKHISEPIDLGLIDGNHSGMQPSDDYQGLKPFLSDSSLLIWHDVQSRYTVGAGLAAAIKDGWSPIVFPTSCRLCVCYKRLSDWDLAMSSFEAAKLLSLV